MSLIASMYLREAGKSKVRYRSTAPCAALKAHGASRDCGSRASPLFVVSKTSKTLGTIARVQSHWQQRIHQEQHAGRHKGPTHKVDEGSMAPRATGRKWMSCSCKSSTGPRLSEA